MHYSSIGTFTFIWYSLWYIKTQETVDNEYDNYNNLRIKGIKQQSNYLVNKFIHMSDDSMYKIANYNRERILCKVKLVLKVLILKE